MAASSKLTWVLLSLIASTSFALIAPFAVLAEQAGLLPGYAVLYRYILLVAIATPLILSFARHHFKFSRQQFWLLILQSCSTAILNISYMAALSFIPVSLTVIIFFISPLITLMVAPLVFGGRVSPIRAVIFFAAFIGLIMVVGPQFSNLDPIGIILALIAAITSVSQLLCMSKLVKEISPVALLYSVHTIAMFITFVIVGVAVSTGNMAAPVAFNIDMSLNFTGIVICYVFGYTLFTIVAKNLEPTTISLISNIEPVVTISIAIIVLGEVLETQQIFGVIVVLGALIIGSLYREKQA
ncbi:MAG: DMT family transporter [Alphaproteobacteria bacterium]|nr:DMT family transporter [Alphaproteobacteria bacterium]